MATADKLSYLSQTKTAIKEAIVEKGVDVSSSDTFRSYADKIKSIQVGGGSGGSKIYVTNETGKEFVEGDKVLVNFSGTEGTEYTSNINLGNYWNKPFMTSSNCSIFNNSYDKRKTETKWTPSGFVSSTYTNVGLFPSGAWPYVFQDNVLKYFITNSSKCAIENFDDMTFIESEYWPLKDDLKLNLATCVIYNDDESLSFDTGIESLYNKKVTIQRFDNTVIVHQTDSILFIDVTNFPECSIRKLLVPLTTAIPYGMTGADEGSFLVFSNGNTYYFYQYTEEEFKPYLNIVVRNGENSQYINVGEGIFCFMRSDNTPVVYMVENKKLVRKNIPIEIFNKIKGRATGTIYRDSICFVCNRDLTHFSWTFSTEQYKDFGVASHAGSDVKIYIAEPEQSNYTDDYSFTGFATGKENKDKVEVSLLLPEEIPLIFETNVPTGDDEIIFEGMK